MEDVILCSEGAVSLSELRRRSECFNPEDSYPIEVDYSEPPPTAMNLMYQEFYDCRFRDFCKAQRAVAAREEEYRKIFRTAFLVRFPKRMWTWQVLRSIKNRNLCPARSEELLTFALRYPDVVTVCRYITALGARSHRTLENAVGQKFDQVLQVHGAPDIFSVYGHSLDRYTWGSSWQFVRWEEGEFFLAIGE